MDGEGRTELHTEGPEPSTWFAPPERATQAELEEAVALATANPVIDAVLRVQGEMLLVLNDQRQILAVNDAYLRRLGIYDAKGIMGLRPGESIGCVHSNDHVHGCGTSRFCSTCGAAIAMVACQQHGEPQEGECVLSVRRGGERFDLDMFVRSTPLVIAGRRFLCLVLRDISSEKRRAALERSFFHDVNNVIHGLEGTSYFLDQEGDHFDPETLSDLRSLIARLRREVEIQRALSVEGGCEYHPAEEEIPLEDLVRAVEQLFRGHPAAQGRVLRLPTVDSHSTLRTDPALLLRILTNMLVNALEASAEGEEVRLDIDESTGSVAFSVWNRAPIPEPVAMRVFQRYFTTKPGVGRGQGTYAIKMFGESLLGGTVDFASSKESGTTFWCRLPRGTARG